MYLIDPEHAFDTSKSQWLPCTVVLGAGALLIHLVMQFRARYADPFILPLVVALNGIGLTMIYRLDPQIAAPVGDGQLMWTGVSMVLCAIIVFVLRDYRLLRKVTYTSLVLSMILLIMPLVPGLGMELKMVLVFGFISVTARSSRVRSRRLLWRFSSPAIWRRTVT